MFTGIVERVGSVASIQSSGASRVLTVECGCLADAIGVGDSVCVSGVCLTATSLQKGCASFDVAPQTVSLSRLGDLRVGHDVNLERAMAADGRFGGHIVQGHVDGVGRIAAIAAEADAHRVRVTLPDRLLRCVVAQGSIALDGISLTVAELQGDAIEVSVIPHTFRNTTLGRARPGDRVNIETDIVARYIERLMAAPASGGITEQTLRSAGFGLYGGSGEL
ncbi:MAG: riboflavin synthase [Armatimonadetes bacterium]|nr:riboflavin synthase [Armatimonadota bacterium]